VAWEFGVDFNVVAVLCTRHVSGCACGCSLLC